MIAISSFFVPVEILYGVGIRKLIGYKVKSLGDTAFIVTDPGIISAGIADEIEQDIKNSGIRAVRFGGVKPNPDVETIDEAFALARQEAVNVVVALGGGSSIDVAKAVGLLLTNGGESIGEYISGKSITNPITPLIAIPTTCGTGSEVTTSSVVVDRLQRRKVSLRQGPLLCARLALIDPELMATLPPHLVAATGMDALTHAIESYLSLVASPITDGCALYAIELLGKYLRPAASNPSNLEAISSVAIGSTIAGLSFGQASTTLVHCISHALGGILDVPHGIANAILLAPVMEFNLPANPEKFARVARALGEHVDGIPIIEAANRSLSAVRLLARDLNIPETLGAIGIKAEDLPDISKTASMEKRLAQNPRRATEREILMILRSIL